MDFFTSRGYHLESSISLLWQVWQCFYLCVLEAGIFLSVWLCSWYDTISDIFLQIHISLFPWGCTQEATIQLIITRLSHGLDIILSDTEQRTGSRNGDFLMIYFQVLSSVEQHLLSWENILFFSTVSMCQLCMVYSAFFIDHRIDILVISKRRVCRLLRRYRGIFGTENFDYTHKLNFRVSSSRSLFSQSMQIP